MAGYAPHRALRSGRPRGTVRLDLRSALLASQNRDATLLTLGYNTAVVSLIHRLRNARTFMNMDGIEWRQQKWSASQRLWLRANEWCGAHLSDHLIAHHPAIKQHLSQLVAPEKITAFPTGQTLSVKPLRVRYVASTLSPGNTMS